MAKPSRTTFNPAATKADGSNVAWNCTKCGKQGAANSRAAAGQQFDKHDCED